MAELNQAQHIFIYGDVKINDLSKSVRVWRFPHDVVKMPNIGIGEKVAVAISKERQDHDIPGCNFLLREIETATLLAGVGDKTLKNVAVRMGTNSLLNLKRLAGIPYIARLSSPLRGIPAFIVSAGPSLDKNIHLLKECSQYGVIIALNTSARPVRLSGAPIDMLVTIESLDSMRTIEAGYLDEGGYPLATIDITAAPSSWTMNAERRAVIVNDDPAFSWTSVHMGGEPLPFGGCVATAAVTVAKYLGASGIYLLGQDLAWTDGRGYASNTLNEALRYEVVDTNLRFTGIPAREGQLLTWLKVPEWSCEPGREVYTTYDMITFIQWFTRANRHRTPGTRGIVNCTEGGANIPGIPSVPLERVLDVQFRKLEYPTNPRRVLERAIDRAPVIRREAIDTTIAELIERADRLEVVANRLADRYGAKAYMDWRVAIEAIPVINAFMAAELAEIRADVNSTFKEQFDRVVQTSIQGARRVREILRG